MTSNTIHVVSAAIIRDNKFLAVQRSEKMLLPGMWEFPGGKIEPNESPEAALIREIKEELDATVRILQEINTAEYDYHFGRVSLTTFTAEVTAGQLTLLEHQNYRWLAPHELVDLDWAPVDIPAAHLLSRMKLL